MDIDQESYKGFLFFFFFPRKEWTRVEGLFKSIEFYFSQAVTQSYIRDPRS